jgi:glycosyltransferase involved in cell wall biosynthesis
MAHNNLRFSVIIPTCDRSSTLFASLKTVTAQYYNNLQIVVQDNASDDRTAAVVNAFKDSRIRYNRISQRVSMRENFETGLAQADGDYLIFIGDDDGLAFEAIERLAKIIQNHPAEMVNWAQTKYFWPSISKDGRGYLMQRFDKSFGAATDVDLIRLQQKLTAGSLFHPKTIGYVYHGCISRELIHRIRKKSKNKYFAHTIPDVFTAYANIFEAKSGVFVNHPLTIAGRSASSNGASFAGNAAVNVKTVDQFAVDNSRDTAMLGDCDVSIRSTNYLHYKCLKNLEQIWATDFRINSSNWQGAIFKELASKGEDIQTVSSKLSNDVDFSSAHFPKDLIASAKKPATENVFKSSNPSRIYCRTEIDGADDVFTAATVLAKLTGGHSPNTNRSTKILKLFKWLKAQRRAVSINK